jgi:hypothetical protein
MNPNDPHAKRKIIILVSALDMVLAGTILLIYFGLLPIDLSSWNIPRWLIGVIGGVWFLGAFAVLLYQLTKTDDLQ